MNNIANNFYREEAFLENIYQTYIKNNKRTDYILTLKINDSYIDLLGERDFPSKERFPTGWWKKMLLRYGLAMHFSKGKNVLETCSGLGWGAYLLDDVAESVTCIDIDKKSINLSKQLWKTNRTAYLCGSVLDIPVQDNAFNVVTTMEGIEHFDLDNIKIYLGEMYRILKPGGFLIGSSAFPNTRKEANFLCKKNKFHIYICTKKEIKYLLREKKFKKIKIFQNRLFFLARKGYVKI